MLEFEKPLSGVVDSHACAAFENPRERVRIPLDYRDVYVEHTYVPYEMHRRNKDALWLAFDYIHIVDQIMNSRSVRIGGKLETLDYRLFPGYFICPGVRPISGNLLDYSTIHADTE